MNLPNKISIFRICCMPVMVAMFLAPIPMGIGYFVALFVYIVGSFSDTVDGIIARKYNLITDFGKFIDQIADKVLSTAGLILVTFSFAIPWTWLSIITLIIIISRDIIISGVRQVAAKNGTVIAADKIGKLKSVVLDTGVGILLFYVGLCSVFKNGEKTIFAGNTTIEFISYIGISLVCLGTLLALISCVNYIIKSSSILKSDKSENEKNSQND